MVEVKARKEFLEESLAVGNVYLMTTGNFENFEVVQGYE